MTSDTAGITDLGINPDNLRLYEHPHEKLSHYSKRTVDIEYRFGFSSGEFGELEGVANRTDFDLSTHSQHSGEDLSFFDQAKDERYTPYVIEPAAGLTRSLMAFLVDAYTEDEAPNAKGGTDTRTVLALDRRLAPIKAAVLPLSRDEKLSPVAKELAQTLRAEWAIDFDDAGAIGRRYRRHDEIGTPFAVTVDFDSLEDQAVTVRERDTMAQERIAIADLPGYLRATAGGSVTAMSVATQTMERPAVQIGDIPLSVPVVLAPMAGITNTAFRRLCREYGAGLYVSEMITSRALVERTEASMRLITHHPSEQPRSIQLYGVDPVTIGEAVTMLVAEDRADHIDLNFGCPVPKVTKNGGGAALPWKLELFRAIVERAVRAAGPIPVTVKMRKGIDSDHLTYLEAGRAAEGAGVSAVALHARTADQFYSGHADWDAIGTLKSTISSIPVLGNGDIWSAEDALTMVAQTECDGVVVGRGCLGKPWLFGDLAAGFRGESVRFRPGLADVSQAFRRHAELLVEFFGGDELRACRDIRKHVAWYFKGYCRRRGSAGEACHGRKPATAR